MVMKIRLPQKSILTKKFIKEKGMKIILFLSAISAIIIIFSIIIFLFRDAYPIFQRIGLGPFLTGMRWNPVGQPPLYGAFPLIIATLLVTLGAMVIAIPLSIGSAIFISEIATPRVKIIIKPAVELLAGIPSVVFGFFGLIVLTTWIRISFNVPTGETWLAGSILLGIMAIPTITSVAEDAISSVPREYKEGSLAVGASRWQTISKIIVPSAMSGITAAIILGIGRAIGETMAVMMVCGNPAYGLIPQPITNVFAPIKTLTATLGIEMGEVATGSNHYYALFGLALILLIITLIVNILATVILGRLKEKQRKSKKKKPVISYEFGRKIKQTFYLLIGTIVIAILFITVGLLPTIGIITLIVVIYYLLRKISVKVQQRLAFSAITATIIIVIIFLGIILAYIVTNGVGALSWDFITTGPTNLGRSGGIFPAIIGTLYLVAGAIAIALPLGVGAAVYLHEYTKEGIITKIIRTGADLLNGTPSIVFGLFGFAFFVLYLKLGFSLLAGQITLAFMILPTIIRTTEEALKCVPQSLREGSYALGASKWQTIQKVVLPPAAPGILTGAILGIGRAAGETAPILFTAVVFSDFISSSVLQPVNALPYHLFTLATSIPGSQQNQAGTALVLLLLVIGIYFIAILLRNQFRKKMKW
ncbi:Binding-protein-dependent transport system inner membrane component [uncultured archaeon]|nr:Binding-protein-dependent transport system inner membrane component [uncultured archaeon]